MIQIRLFQPPDRDALVEILRANDQLSHPSVDGAEAMLRVASCVAADFLVADHNGVPVGLIRTIYDGSRALIHELSVHPDHQRRGIGGRLVEQAVTRLKSRGAPSVSVTVNEQSASYWSRLGFERTDVSLMLKMLPDPTAAPASECVRYLGRSLEVLIDRPMGSKHPEHGYVYPINYGYIPNAKAGDVEEQDAYVLGVFEPIDRIEAVCIAVIHRVDDVEDKLVVTPQGKQYTDDQIAALTEFQEQYFESDLLRG